MKKAILLFVIFLFAVQLQAQTSEVTDQVIIKFKEGVTVNPGKSDLALANFGIAKLDAVNHQHSIIGFHKLDMGRDSKDEVYTLKFPKTEIIENIMSELNAMGLFAYTEPDYIGHAIGVPGHSDAVSTTTPNDGLYYEQWALNNNGTFTHSGDAYAVPSGKAGADIKMPLAWDIEKGSSTVKVGFIDTGCKLDHPEFSGRIWVNTGEIPNNGIDDDGNGYIDDVNGWDFQNNDKNPMDDEGHGTNVASIVGANGNNAVAFAGMDWNCKLMITKGLDATSSGYYSVWVSCIHYLVDNGANVINMSVSGPSYSSTLQSGTDYAYTHNVLIVASMGNLNTSAPNYPAANTNVMAVGATNPDDTRCNPFFWGGGSSFGSNISVCAPGNVIYGLDYQSNTNYNYYWGGTSQSTPHVVALAALLKAQLSSRTAVQIRSIIESTADDLVGKSTEDTPGWDQYFGFGRINAYRALRLLTDVTAVENSPGDFEVFPNPAHQLFSVRLNHASVFDSKIMITDMTGQIVSRIASASETTPLEFNLAQGIYFVTLQNEKESVTKKIIVF